MLPGGVNVLPVIPRETRGPLEPSKLLSEGGLLILRSIAGGLVRSPLRPLKVGVLPSILLMVCLSDLLPDLEGELPPFGPRPGLTVALLPDLARSRLRSKIEEAPVLASAELYPRVRG